MRRYIVSLCFILMTSTSAAETNPGMEAPIVVLEEFHAAIGLGELHRIEPLLDPDIRQLAMNARDVHGRQATLSWWQAVVNQRLPDRVQLLSTTTVDEIVVLEDRAFARGRWVLEAPQGGTSHQPKRFKYLALFRRDNHGVWRIVQHGFNSDGRDELP